MIKASNKMSKKNKCQHALTFQAHNPTILDQKHPIWKYLKALLPINQMLKDKIREKNSII